MGYEQLSNYGSLRDRVLELRRSGHTTAQIAKLLNEQGYRPPRGGEQFSNHMIIEFLKRLGLHGPSPGPRLDHTMLGTHEWSLKGLGRHLGIPVKTLSNWCRRGWVHCRKLSGPKGCLIIWADSRELNRLRKLHAFRPINSPPPYPAELTTPGPRSGGGKGGRRHSRN